MAVTLSTIQHQSYTIVNGSYECNKCNYTVKVFGYIVDHIRNEECYGNKKKSEKRKKFERWGIISLDVMRYIKYHPVGLTKEAVRAGLKKYTPSEIHKSQYYLVKKGYLDKIEDKLYPGRNIL